MNYINLIEDKGLIFKGDRKIRYGVFKCLECGVNFEIQIRNNTKAEKCRKCIAKSVRTRHGKSNTKLFSVWCGMKDRCYRQKNKSYENYGLRGIIVCDEWRNDFKSFYTWAISNGYKEGLSIDRINNNGNYEPNNCRWADAISQSENTRLLSKRNKSGYRGVSKQNNGYIARITYLYKSVCIGTFKTKIEAAKAYDKYIIDNNINRPRNFNEEY